MKSTNLHCLRAGSSFQDRTSSNIRPIDSRTTQAFHQLRLHAEELALELAVRLRVLGKSLSAACPAKSAAPPLSSYGRIRRQLDNLFRSVEDRDFAGGRYVLVIRHYLEGALPPELTEAACTEPCRVELVDGIIFLLTENACEEDFFAESLSASYSR